MALFTAMNLAGAHFMAESNSIVVIWKTAVPLLAIIVIAALSFHWGNFDSGEGVHALRHSRGFRGASAGVVFALQGFEQAVQLAGEARDPKKDMSRAIIVAMAIGGTIYILLQFVFIAAVNPATSPGLDLAARPRCLRRQGAWHTLAVAVGAAHFFKFSCNRAYR